MNSKEQEAFDSLTVELSRALAVLGEPALENHPAFSVEPGWFPGLLHVHIVREGAAPLVFIADDDWVRVDVGLLPEVLQFPLNLVKRAWRRPRTTFADALPRLLTSSVTVRRQRRSRSVFLTDQGGEVWGRYTNYTRTPHADGPAEVTYKPVVTPPERWGPIT